MSNVIIKPKGSSMFEVRDGGPEGRLVRKFTTELEAALYIENQRVIEATAANLRDSGHGPV